MAHRRRLHDLSWAIASLVLLGCVHAPSTPFPLRASGGAEIRWHRTIASAEDDWINDIVRLRDGAYLAPGFLNRREIDTDWRALAVKVDARGRLLRQSEYGVGAMVDAFWGVAEAPDGGLVHVGFTDRLGAGGLDAFVLRTDARGMQQFETAIGESDYDRLTSIVAAPDGGWLAVGHSVKPGTPHRRLLLVKLTASGAESWRKIFLEGDASGGLYIAPTPDGAFVLTGGTTRREDADLLVLKVDAEGNERWRRVFGGQGTPDINHGVVVRPDGDIVAVGYTQSWGAEANDFFALTLSPDGAVRRHSVLGGAGDDRAMNARLDGDGRIWVAGYTRTPDPSAWDAMLAVIDARGCFIPGAALLSGPVDDHGTVVQFAGDDLLLAGYSKGLGGGGEDAFLLRMTKPRLDDARFQTRVSC